jgi:hypothetical protein
LARRTRIAQPRKTVVFHPLPERPERVQRVTSGELEPPCYGSVRPVVWGLGVRIPWLPDSASYYSDMAMAKPDLELL